MGRHNLCNGKTPWGCDFSICPEAEGKVIILDMLDVYRRDEPELVEILKE